MSSAVKSERDAMDGSTARANVIRSQVAGLVPRFLTQLDRDCDSPTFGCFDRNYWHYKIRDFSSAVLQQGILALDALHALEWPGNPVQGSAAVRDWVRAGIRFWASIQLRGGGFNEYYPFEEGYPPTAFGLYAVALTVSRRPELLEDPAVAGAIQRAGDWILAHRESEALNQEAAGLCGLVAASRLAGVRIDAKELEARLSAFLDSQSDEGWFPEYGGADTGYLSVTIDALWDMYEITGEERFIEAARGAADFISWFVTGSGCTPAMTNSRNTDYMVPYGLVRLAESHGPAAGIVDRLLMRHGDSHGCLAATDDRYLCHYVYQSWCRAARFLAAVDRDAGALPCERECRRYFAGAGTWVRHDGNGRGVMVGAAKGGIVYVFGPDGIRAADYGWRASGPGRDVLVTHWLDPGYVVEFSEDGGMCSFEVEGRMTRHGRLVPSPLKHAALRILSRFAGRRVIPHLKKMMIFRGKPSPVGFSRRIRIDADEAVIEDRFRGDDAVLSTLRRAGCHSLRHVASADNFTMEEMLAADASESEDGGDVRRRRIRVEIKGRD